MNNSFISKFFSPEDIVHLLIDYENLPKGLAEYVFFNLAKYCVRLRCVVYADWGGVKMQLTRNAIEHLGHETFHVPKAVRGKNAADMEMSCDGMDALNMGGFSVHCLVTQDRDLTPLIKRVNARGLKTVSFGGERPSVLLANSCGYYGVLREKHYSAYEGAFRRRAAEQMININKRLCSIIVDAIESNLENGMAKKGVVIEELKKRVQIIEPENYFCENWVQFFKATYCCRLAFEEGDYWLSCK